MDLQRLRLPVWILVRAEHVDEKTGQVRISSDMGWLGSTVAGTRCFPLFTTAGALRNFISEHGTISGGSKALRCDALNLLQILEAIAPESIVIDPTGDSGLEDILDGRITIAGLKTRAREGRG